MWNGANTESARGIMRQRFMPASLDRIRRKKQLGSPAAPASPASPAGMFGKLGGGKRMVY